MAVLLCASVVVLAAAEMRARSARRLFDADTKLGGRRWALVERPADALSAWAGMGVSGRRLVVYTGRWPTLAPEELERLVRDPPDADSLADDDASLLLASRWGIARRLVVVLPPDAWRERVARLRPTRGFSEDVGCVRAPFMGIQREFCVPDRVPAALEQSLVLVEASYFDGSGGAVPNVDVSATDLAIVASSDPSASARARERATAFAAARGAVPIEVER